MFISNRHFGVGTRAQIMLLESVFFFVKPDTTEFFHNEIFMKAAENPKPCLRRLEHGFYRKSIDSMKFHVIIFERLSKNFGNGKNQSYRVSQKKSDSNNII